MFLQIPFLLRPQTAWVLWTLLTSPSLRTSQHPKQQATCSSSICQCILRCGACSISRKWCFSIPWPALQSSMVGWQMPWPRSIRCSPLTTEEWERAPVLRAEIGQGIALFPSSCCGPSQDLQGTMQFLDHAMILRSWLRSPAHEYHHSGIASGRSSS